MEMELYVIVEWPEYQDLMEVEGFEENAFALADHCAYAVRKKWYDSVSTR